MSATIKFAFHAIFSKPVRLIISFLLITVTLFITAVFIFFNSTNFSDYEKEIYFSDKNPFSDSVYLNYWNTSFFNHSDAGNQEDVLSFSITEELTSKLSSYGYGYAVTQRGRQPTAHEQGGTSMSYAGSVLGAYRLDSFFGCYDLSMFQYGYDAIFNGANRFFDDEDNIAPFFPSRDAYAVSYAAFYKGTTCLVDGTEVSALDTFGYSVYGRLPEKANEVVIPQSIYNAFAAYGYCDAGDIEQEDNVRGEVEEINSYDDIIGKTIKLGTGEAMRSACIDATIVGVLEVDYEEHNWSYYIGSPSEEQLSDWSKNGYISLLYTYPLFFDIIVSKEYFDAYADEDSYADLVTVSKNVEEGILEDYVDISLRWEEGLTMREITNVDFFHITYYANSDTQADAVLAVLSGMLFVIEPYFPFVYVALPFCFLLAGFLLYSSIENRRRQTGILRSLGAGEKQITLSFFLALAVFCLICAVAAALLLQCGLIPQLNTYMDKFFAGLNLFRLTWTVVLFLFGYPLLIAAAVAGLYFVRERSTTIISQLSPVAKKAGRKRN